jgi:hypothetical protein
MELRFKRYAQMDVELDEDVDDDDSPTAGRQSRLLSQAKAQSRIAGPKETQSNCWVLITELWVFLISFLIVGPGRKTRKGASRGKGSSTSRATRDKTKKQKTASSGAKGSGSALLDQLLRECDPGEAEEDEEPPEKDAGNSDCEVAEILAYTEEGRYLVSWKGYAKQDATEEPPTHLEHAKERVMRFHIKHGTVPQHPPFKELWDQKPLRRDEVNDWLDNM